MIIGEDLPHLAPFGQELHEQLTSPRRGVNVMVEPIPVHIDRTNIFHCIISFFLKDNYDSAILTCDGHDRGVSDAPFVTERHHHHHYKKAAFDTAVL